MRKSFFRKKGGGMIYCIIAREHIVKDPEIQGTFEYLSICEESGLTLKENDMSRALKFKSKDQAQTALLFFKRNVIQDIRCQYEWKVLEIF